MQWVYSGQLDALDAYAKERIIVFDTETTGLDPETDEILQISIINGLGEVLFSSYIKPSHWKRWDKAAEINGITPTMVADAPVFEDVAEHIQHFFRHADLVVGYNVRFDIDFLTEKGLFLRKGSHVFDVMTEFSSFRGLGKWPKLTECAEYFHYRFSAHDALEDTRATLFCFDALLAEQGYRELVNAARPVKEPRGPYHAAHVRQQEPQPVRPKFDLFGIGVAVAVTSFICLAFLPDVLTGILSFIFIGGVAAACVGWVKRRKNRKVARKKHR